MIRQKSVPISTWTSSPCRPFADSTSIAQAWLVVCVCVCFCVSLRPLNCPLKCISLKTGHTRRAKIRSVCSKPHRNRRRNSVYLAGNEPHERVPPLAPSNLLTIFCLCRSSQGHFMKDSLCFGFFEWRGLFMGLL